jgi:hypothetical protein
VRVGALGVQVGAFVSHPRGDHPETAKAIFLLRASLLLPIYIPPIFLLHQLIDSSAMYQT